MKARMPRLIKQFRRRIFRRFRRHAPGRNASLVCGRKQRRDLGEGLSRESILELHRQSPWDGRRRARNEWVGTGGKQRPKNQTGRLLEAGSSTHNEFRLAVRPLSGDQGVSAPLLINTRGGSKL